VPHIAQGDSGLQTSGYGIAGSGKLWSVDVAASTDEGLPDVVEPSLIRHAPGPPAPPAAE